MFDVLQKTGSCKFYYKNLQFQGSHLQIEWWCWECFNFFQHAKSISIRVEPTFMIYENSGIRHWEKSVKLDFFLQHKFFTANHGRKSDSLPTLEDDKPKEW